MPRLSRIYQKIFGSAAGATEIGQFGSLAAGSPTTTTNPVTMQSLAAFNGGWFDAVLGGNSPAIEDMNALNYLTFYQLAYVMENGITEYNSTTTYYQGSVVQYNNQYYKCLVNGTLGVTPAIGVNWQYLADSQYAKATAAGTNQFALSTTIQGQLDQLDAAIYSNPPSGSILAYAGAVASGAPTGYLFCDGSSISTSTYSRLFSVIGYTYGGSGASFSLPNTQGIFIRGAGTQTVTPNTYTATLAQKLIDRFASHTHTTNASGQANFNSFTGTSPSNDAGNGDNEVNGVYSYTNSHTHTINATGTGTETFPANIALNYIIRF
jgi:microcystin-dependent protein